MPLGVKTGPTPGVTSWNNCNREGRIHFVGKKTQVSDPGPSWPSCFLTLSQTTNLRPFKLQELIDNNLNLMKMLEYSLKARKRCMNRRMCSLQAISSFATDISKGLYCLKMRACLV